MSTQLISTINNEKIVIVIDEETNEKFVPIKPICEALGVVTDTQKRKIEDDEILSSVTTLKVATGSDGKQYKMTAIPLKFVFGWLFSISAKNVNEDSREKLINYKLMCYNALYNYFTEHASFIEQKEKN